jgi:hypothetical protein
MNRQYLTVVRVAVWTAFAVAACSTSGGGSPSGQNGTSIGPAGGGVTATDGSGVTVPAGAVAVGSSINVTVTADPGAPAPPADQWIAVGPAYLFGPEGQQFLRPVTVTLAFDPTRLPSGRTVNDVVLVTSPATGAPSYASLATTVVDATHVSAQTTHFSIIMAAAPVGGFSDAGPDAAEPDGSQDGGLADSLVEDSLAADATEDIEAPDAPGADGTVGDAAADAALDADAALECVEPTNAAPVIQQTFSCASPPVPAGGTIVDGTYYLTSSVKYEQGDANCSGVDHAAQATVVVSGGMISIVEIMPSAWFVGPYTTSGTLLNFGTPCADAGFPSGSLGYTATSTTLSVSVPLTNQNPPATAVGTLTRQ